MRCLPGAEQIQASSRYTRYIRYIRFKSGAIPAMTIQDPMKIREAAIAKLQQLPEPLLAEVDDFIDFVIHKHQAQLQKSTDDQPDQEELARRWAKWVDEVEQLAATPIEEEEDFVDEDDNDDTLSDYQQAIVEKYRKQGLEI
jgi:hypothetical protein